MRVLIVCSDRSTAHQRAINLGDAMLTDALVGALRERGHSAEVVDFGGIRSGRGEPRTHTHGLRDLVVAMRRSDAVLIGGGTLLQDDDASAPLGLGGLPRLCAAAVVAAKFTRTPAAFFAVGCDPVRRTGARLLLRFAVRSVPVWVRETTSRQRVRDQFGASAQFAGDAALLMERQESLSAPDGPVVVALNSAHARGLTAADVGALRSNGRELVFLNMSQGAGDLHDSSVVPADALALFDLVTADLDWVDAFDIIRSASAVYASRMHALYAAAILHRPMVAVSSLPKVVTFAEEFGVPIVSSPDAWAVPAPGGADRAVLAAAADRVSEALDHALLALGARN